MNKTNISDDEFLAEVRKLGGTERGALDWLQEARAIGINSDDTAASLAWTCVDDELSGLDPETESDRIKTLKSSLSLAFTE